MKKKLTPKKSVRKIYRDKLGRFTFAPKRKKKSIRKKKAAYDKKKSIRKNKTYSRKARARKKHVSAEQRKTIIIRRQRRDTKHRKPDKIRIRKSRKRITKAYVKKRKRRAQPKPRSTVKLKLKSIRGKVLKREPKARLMQTALEKSARQLKTMEPTILGPHVNKDGSIDGEIRTAITGDYRVFFRRIIRYYPRMRGAWIIFIVFFEPDIENFYDLSDFYVRRGLAGIPIHAALADDTGAVKGLYARMVSERIEEGSGFKPVEISLRLHWNKNRQRPRYD